MVSRTKLTKEDFDLVQAAKETADRLHVDDIHEVAAAVRTKEKKVFTGIHTNSSCADVCGEVAALSHALAHGYRDFEAIVAVWGDGKGTYELLSPCGKCRQLISGFGGDIWIVVGSPKNPYKVAVADMLPLRYESNHNR